MNTLTHLFMNHFLDWFGLLSTLRFYALLLCIAYDLDV